MEITIHVGECNFTPLTSSPVVPAGHRYCSGLPGICCPHHPAGLCSQDSLKDETLGPRAHSLGRSEGHHRWSAQQCRGVGELWLHVALYLYGYILQRPFVLVERTF